mmetsp:Transcript_26579/g.75073  ORF Transcript_26579/g.75073 Transcript_26579/m.75073 type:complete len:214 (+) Transcript_26579:143-784(+)
MRQDRAPVLHHRGGHGARGGLRQGVRQLRRGVDRHQGLGVRGDGPHGLLRDRRAENQDAGSRLEDLRGEGRGLPDGAAEEEGAGRDKEGQVLRLRRPEEAGHALAGQGPRQDPLREGPALHEGQGDPGGRGGVARRARGRRGPRQAHRGVRGRRARRAGLRLGRRRDGRRRRGRRHGGRPRREEGRRPQPPRDQGEGQPGPAEAGHGDGLRGG